jgi:ATP-dependent DNA helicase PIF1
VVKFDKYPPLQHATIKSRAIWKNIKQFCLKQNMRLARSSHGGDNNQNIKFAKSLLAMGKGKGQAKDFGLTKLQGENMKSTMTTEESENVLLNFVYGNLVAGSQKLIEHFGKYLFEHEILLPLNKDVKQMNALVTSKLPGVPTTSRSINLPDPDGYDSLPKECLNKVLVSGLPEHLINLKIGMPIVISRNLYPNKGVCNGSRLIVIEIGTGHIVGQLLSGLFKGDEVMIPKIKLHQKGSVNSALSFYRYQFPLSLAFAMSINKIQGQTLEQVGVYLETDVFAHGQLYIACLRVTNCKNLLVVKPACRSGVVNVVHKSIFSGSGDS